MRHVRIVRNYSKTFWTRDTCDPKCRWKLWYLRNQFDFVRNRFVWNFSIYHFRSDRQVSLKINRWCDGVLGQNELITDHSYEIQLRNLNRLYDLQNYFETFTGNLSARCMHHADRSGFPAIKRTSKSETMCIKHGWRSVSCILCVNSLNCHHSECLITIHSL